MIIINHQVQKNYILTVTNKNLKLHFLEKELGMLRMVIVIPDLPWLMYSHKLRSFNKRLKKLSFCGMCGFSLFGGRFLL